MKFSNPQFDQFENKYDQLFRAKLKEDLRRHHVEYSKTEIESLFCECETDCAALCIYDEDGIEAYFFASFYCGEPIRRSPNFEIEHDKAWVRYGYASAYSIAFYEKIAREAELL